MATAIGDLIIRFGAQTRGVERGTRRVRGLLRQTTGVVGSLVRSFAPLSGGLLLAGVARAGENFNQKMRESLAIMGDVSKEMEKQMRATAFNVARDTKFGASQAAEAYYFLASAGLSAESQIKAMPQVARFAQAGNFDLATATDLATDAQAALGLTSTNSAQNLLNLTRVTDVLTKANTLANASSEQFSKALTNKAGAAMRTVGMEIEEGVAILSAWADQGLKGEEAGTAMNIVLRDLQSQAIKNARAFEQMNIAVYEAGELRHMTDIIGDLEKRLEGMTGKGKKATLMQLGFSDKSMIFLQTLIGTSQKIGDYNQELDEAGGTTKEVADKQLGALNKGFQELSASATQAGASIMTDLGPALGDTMSGMAEVVEMTEALVGGLVALSGGDVGDKAEGVFTKIGRGIRMMGMSFAWLAARAQGDELGTQGIENEVDRLAEKWGQQKAPVVGPSAKAIERLQVHAREGSEVAQKELTERGLAWEEAEPDSVQLTKAISLAEEKLVQLGKTAGDLSHADSLEEFLEPLRDAGVDMATLDEMAARFLDRLGQADTEKLEESLQKQIDDWNRAVSQFGASDRQAVLADLFAQMDEQAGKTGDPDAAYAEMDRLKQKYLNPLEGLDRQLTEMEAKHGFEDLAEKMADQLFELESGASAATMAIRQFAREPGATPEQVRHLEEMAERIERLREQERLKDEAEKPGGDRPEHAEAAGYRTQKAYSTILAATGAGDPSQRETARNTRDLVREARTQTAIQRQIAAKETSPVDLPPA